MTIRELTYRKGTHDKNEHILVTFEVSDGVDRIDINIQNLCNGFAEYRTECGNYVELSVSIKLEILRYALRERERILANYPVKTRAGWTESGINSLMDYCNPGDEVDEAMVDYGLNVVPPVTHRRDLIQVGEPYSDALDETGVRQPIYSTFGREGGIWRYLGECFCGQTKNKVKIHRSLERAIQSLLNQ